MIKIYISATGKLKQYLRGCNELMIERNSRLRDVKLKAGIPADQTCGFMVNGLVKRADDTLSEGEEVKFIMLVGAG